MDDNTDGRDGTYYQPALKEIDGWWLVVGGMIPSFWSEAEPAFAMDLCGSVHARKIAYLWVYPVLSFTSTQLN